MNLKFQKLTYTVSYEVQHTFFMCNLKKLKGGDVASHTYRFDLTLELHSNMLYCSRYIVHIVYIWIERIMYALSTCSCRSHRRRRRPPYAIIFDRQYASKQSYLHACAHPSSKNVIAMLYNSTIGTVRQNTIRQRPLYYARVSESKAAGNIISERSPAEARLYEPSGDDMAI